MKRTDTPGVGRHGTRSAWRTSKPVLQVVCRGVITRLLLRRFSGAKEKTKRIWTATQSHSCKNPSSTQVLIVAHLTCQSSMQPSTCSIPSSEHEWEH